MRFRVHKRRGDRESGASLVEMALVSILLLLLIAAIADFGRAFFSYIAIQNAAREGARFGARMDQMFKDGRYVPDEYIEKAVIHEAANSGVNLSKTNITIEPQGEHSREAGDPMTVTVRYTMTTVFSGLVGLDEIPMQSRNVMVMYGSEKTPAD